MNYFKFQRIKRQVKRFGFVALLLAIVVGVAYYGFYDFSVRAAGTVLFIGLVVMLLISIKALTRILNSKGNFFD